jgi:hypothetical protein
MKIRRLAPVAACACIALASHAQKPPGKAGAYTGTFEVSGSERNPQVTYKATVKVNLPVTTRTADAIEADFLAGDATATVKVTQYEYFFKEKSADSSGHFQETKCSLAGAMEVPAMAMGVLNVDLRKKRYDMSLTITPTKEIALNCTSTRGTPKFTKKQGIGMALGTGAPGMQAEKPQPLTDPARLAAKFTMDASTQSGGAVGPVVQEWDLKLSQ